MLNFKKNATLYILKIRKMCIVE